ncbi:MAG: glycosyltransferase family 2 protein [Gemmataceae bacterium]|jgi:glycosyltransferase involved in cell wall biosynthesis|nr:glycosyltransferase family 2 protein [Gemmataceae bacterium]
MSLISVVVPVKDEQDNIAALYQRVREALRTGPDWELVVVDDGSTDQTLAELRKIATVDPRVKVVSLRRNFGQAAAMQAGLDAAMGDLVATMDGDLQNDPDDIPLMIAKIEEGYDLVLGRRLKRKDALLIRKVPSLVANWLIRKVTGLPYKDFGCTLRVMKRELAENMRIYGEMHRFIPVLANNLGARITQIDVRHHPRTAGRSKYGIGRTGRVLLDLMTIRFLSRYITRPMHFMGGIGLLFLILAFVSVAVTCGMKIFNGVDMTGNPLLLLSALLFLAGMQFLATGLMGEIITRTYFESQDMRPYVIRESLNLERTPGDTRNIRAA